MSTAVKARVNQTLPHTVSQVQFLHFLLDARYGKDEAFTALVDSYLDAYSAERRMAVAAS
jgi:hypothetical protein